MKKLNADSKKNIGIRRLFNNLLHSISKSAMISSKIRVFIHSLRGVKFENMNTVFIGEDVIIDKMNPQNVKIGDRCLIAAGVKYLLIMLIQKTYLIMSHITLDFMMVMSLLKKMFLLALMQLLQNQ